jgi:hypothetical protein
MVEDAVGAGTCSGFVVKNRATVDEPQGFLSTLDAASSISAATSCALET